MEKNKRFSVVFVEMDTEIGAGRSKVLTIKTYPFDGIRCRNTLSEFSSCNHVRKALRFIGFGLTLRLCERPLGLELLHDFLNSCTR